MLLALIFAVGFSSPDSSKQLVSTLVLVAGIAAACWIGARITRNRTAGRSRLARQGAVSRTRDGLPRHPPARQDHGRLDHATLDKLPYRPDGESADRSVQYGQQYLS